MHRKNIMDIQSRAKLLLTNTNTPNLDIELLLAHLLNKDRVKIISATELTLSIEQEKKFYQLVRKRSQGISIAQILGEKEFWKHKFIVSKDTLVPRPDSESIITTLLDLYPKKRQMLTIADFGTGTGCLIIGALLEYQNSYGIAFEKSKSAYNIAYKNLCVHNLRSRVRIIYGSWEKCKKKVDVIISNPPYIRSSVIESLPNTISKYEPQIALDGGNNGLNCYRSIIKVAKKSLKKNGHLLLEIGDEKQLLQIKKIANQDSFKFYKSYQDLSKSKRCIVFTQ